MDETVMVEMNSERQFVRLAETARAALTLEVDGVEIAALAGDTVLTALLTAGRRLRDNEFDGAPRAGFCLMGACQDCWIWAEDGARIRACSTLAEAGMRLTTSHPFLKWPKPASS
jgi:NADH dehydrogenase/NADH:ubiquinone oxidoreductase subunit G